MTSSEIAKNNHLKTNIRLFEIILTCLMPGDLVDNRSCGVKRFLVVASPDFSVSVFGLTRSSAVIRKVRRSRVSRFFAFGLRFLIRSSDSEDAFCRCVCSESTTNSSAECRGPQHNEVMLMKSLLRKIILLSAKSDIKVSVDRMSSVVLFCFRNNLHLLSPLRSSSTRNS